ncbi:hypothetical protein ACS0TY_016666 [Phlomoides rotata]
MSYGPFNYPIQAEEDGEELSTMSAPFNYPIRADEDVYEDMWNLPVEDESQPQKYLPLYRAILTEDWKKAETILKKDENAIKGSLTFNTETALHVAIGMGTALYFVQNLVDMMPDDMLGVENRGGVTPLHVAAMKGNTEAAKMLVGRRWGLVYGQTKEGLLPIHFAAESGHRETLAYLILNTRDHDGHFYSGQSGLKLLFYTIDAGLYDGFQFRSVDMKRKEALELVKCLCKNIQNLDDLESQTIYGDAMMEAIHCGTLEAVQIILEAFPETIITATRKREAFVFGMAAENRCEVVFQLIQRTSILSQRRSLENLDFEKNNILHRTAKLAPSHKLNLVPSAALQMQREMQWYKEMEKLVAPLNREVKNTDNNTPWMVFTKEHEKLKSDAETWLKQTANSCSIVAALIATVVFTAAITVPGGNKERSGFPFFSGETAFIVFAIADAISLFASIVCLLMFLAIITSRFAEEDFLYALPMRLSFCLVSVFISILFMMVAFGATVYIVFGKKNNWIIIPLYWLSSWPMACFMYTQTPLLFDIISNTYGAGNLGKRIKRLKIGG